MTNLIRIENNDGLEFHIDTATNLVYASIRATARMLGVEASTISRNPVAQMCNKKAEILTTQGMRSVSLLSAPQVFELAFKYNLELAKRMGAAGANVFMLGLSGYKVQAVEPQPPAQLTRLELAHMIVDAETKLAEAQAKIEADSAKVAFAELLETSPTAISLSDYAKSIERGRTRFYQDLRNAGILQATGNVQPYQKYIDAGYFEMTMGKYYPVPVTFVTPKGRTWLGKKVAALDKAELTIVQVEKELSFEV
jgi:phage antirepressor YoqD-like protein